MHRKQNKAMQELFFSDVMITAVYAALQGILEAFPISSSMHLKLLQQYFQHDNLSISKEIMHLGTAFAFFAICFPFIKRMLVNLLRRKNLRYHLTIMAKLAILTLPTIVVGYYIKDMIFSLNELHCNILAAILMLFADFMPRKNGIIRATFLTCCIIGIIISIALFPGFSRLGITYTAFRLFRFRRFDALFLTILIGIPITFGASTIGIIHHIHDPMLPNMIIFSLLGGILTYITFFITFRALKCWWIFSAYRLLLSTILL